MNCLTSIPYLFLLYFYTHYLRMSSDLHIHTHIYKNTLVHGHPNPYFTFELIIRYFESILKYLLFFQHFLNIDFSLFGSDMKFGDQEFIPTITEGTGEWVWSPCKPLQTSIKTDSVYPHNHDDRRSSISSCADDL